MARKSPVALIAIFALAIAAFAAPSAQAALKHFDGTVVAKDADAGTFRIATQSGTLRIKVTAATEFERIAGGFGGLRKGAKIEVDARQSANGLVAVQVEPQGGNGGGSDHGPNHT